MAETVKKSRIVSDNDDDLEEALMEEFNQRLKKCMSQDDLQQTAEEEEENINEKFIKAEKQNGYPKEDSIYENVGHQTNKTEIEKSDQYIDMSGNPEIKDEEVAVYEDIDDDLPIKEKPNLILTDLCDVKPNENETKSVKDRMLLSTDVAPCLLFTQTVTSPMLTPSEENIDFLKGFRRESNDETKDENIYENAEFLKNQNNEAIYENLKENIYENLKDLNGKQEGEEIIYQNVEELRDNNDEEAVKDDEIEEEKSELVDESVDDIVTNQIDFESEESTQVTESYVETTTIESNSSEKGIKKKKSKKSRKEEKENISVNGTNNVCEDSFYNVNVKNLCRSFGDLTKITDECHKRTKSSFSKFDALQKKNVLHIRSSDSSKAQEKFNGAQIDPSNCRSCGKAVFQMEQIKAEKAVWHKNCFRCTECNKQLNVDTYQSNEGSLYCKPHFKALFAPKAVEDDASPKPRKPELIIRESQPVELPPDVVRASDKPDLGLEELQSLNVKERFQVFEHHQSETSEERIPSHVNVKRSPSILSKLAKFQAKGMDIGVADDSLNGIPIEESSSEEEEEEEDDGIEGEDADLIRAKRVQKEKPFHFTGMSDVKSKWEQGEQLTSRDERREERKQEIQSIRNRLFMGKQGKMKEAYQQAVMESESCTNLKKETPIEVCDTKSLKEKFEKGEVVQERAREKDAEETEVFESEISKKSRSLFLELDANASKPPQITPITTPKIDVKKARDNYLSRSASEDVVKSSVNVVDDVQIRTSDIQQRFKFFETYKEPEKEKKSFRITPPREGQVKASTPDREVYRDPEIVRSEEIIEDSVIAKETHTATKMLNKFRQMEENLAKEPQPIGPKPLKRFTPPPEPTRPESSSEAESASDEETEEEDEIDRGKIADEDLIEAQKAARAKQLRAKFERWEANEIKKEQNNSSVNIIEELGEEQSQIESTKTLRARFESMRESSTETRQPRVKVNRFVELPNITETCESCNSRVYPLEKISVHNHIYHKSCFKCMECNCVLRMDSYSYNQGLLYCMPHFKRLFISKGNYDTGFGLGQHKEKWNATIA
ncbi:LIM domain and actin-binding protein 1 isoform X3 [Tribolium madens]|uniref:LIM domain and actin-binding protein 1 isoform X3 n=1 Tax=Tribolium madens TaxID=41895 RepID=UPI001CF72BD3|nr:LIM domain and actin-binding protein 1 isoform X3 [Tribolium madens]